MFNRRCKFDYAKRLFSTSVVVSPHVMLLLKNKHPLGVGGAPLAPSWALPKAHVWPMWHDVWPMGLTYDPWASPMAHGMSNGMSQIGEGGGFSGTMSLKYDTCRQNQASKNFPAATHRCPRLPLATRGWPRKRCHELPLRPHLHARRGQDDVS